MAALRLRYIFLAHLPWDTETECDLKYLPDLICDLKSILIFELELDSSDIAHCVLGYVQCAHKIKFPGRLL